MAGHGNTMLNNHKRKYVIIIILFIIIAILIIATFYFIKITNNNNSNDINNNDGITMNKNSNGNDNDSESSLRYIEVNKSDNSVNDDERTNSMASKRNKAINNDSNDSKNNMPKADEEIEKTVNDICTQLVNNPNSLIGINDSSKFDIDYINSQKNELYMYMHADEYPQSIDGLMTVSPRGNSDYSLGNQRIGDVSYADSENIAYTYTTDITKSGSKYTDITMSVIIDSKTKLIRNITDIKYGKIPKPSDETLSDGMKKLIENGQNSITMNPHSK